MASTKETRTSDGGRCEDDSLIRNVDPVWNAETRRFSPEALVRATAPIDEVVDSFARLRDDDGDDGGGGGWTSLRSQDEFATLLTSVVDENPWPPSRRYARKLLLRFVSRLEREGATTIESETLTEVVAAALRPFGAGVDGVGEHDDDDDDHRSSASFDANAPDPTESCHVSFLVPSRAVDDDDDDEKACSVGVVPIRVFPFHNDVGVSRAWEAGCCLAEFLLRRPSHVRGRRVLELGAGVGLTGIVAASRCGAASVHMTDFTETTLDNLRHNVEAYQRVVRRTNDNEKEGRITSNDVGGRSLALSGQLGRESDGLGYGLPSQRTNSRRPTKKEPLFHCFASHVARVFSGTTIRTFSLTHYEPIDSYALTTTTSNKGYLKWGEPPDDDDDDGGAALSTADVMIAADVVYDRNDVPDLVRTVRTFLETTSGDDDDDDDDVAVVRRSAVFATTFRNRATFERFETELETNRVRTDFVSPDVIESLPRVFPCYFDQPRSDVRVCVMTLRDEDVAETRRPNRRT